MNNAIELLSEIVGILKNNTKDKRWLTPKELYIEYSFEESTMNKYRMDKKIPFSKVSAMVRYDRTQIDKWLENHEEVSLDECD